MVGLDGIMHSESKIPHPPVAAKRPTTRTHHGDTFTDDYEWLREKQNPQVIEHLQAENRYTEAISANQEQLRQEIFDEIKSRTVETDLSVPTRRRGWWYFTRSVEGQPYLIHSRVKAADTGDLEADWTRR